MIDESIHEKAAPRLDAGTRLAFQRTYLAHERTQMAWVRTGLTLISFGFTIAKFFQYLDQTQRRETPLLAPRTVGILMITIGVGGLTLASLQHRRALRALHQQCPELPVSLAGAMAALLALLGTLAMVGALIRW
jgi:putative membrane protein